MKKFINKRIEKFKNQSIFNKVLDIVLVLLIVLIIIPSTRKELMTYTSKLRMLVTSVDKKEGEVHLKGKESLLLVNKKGEEYALEDFNDKPVFINYWATWCPPCRAEMPSLKKLYQDYKSQVHFLFITREPFKKTDGYLNKKGYDLPVYRLKSKPSGDLAYKVLPTSLFISDNDQVVLKKRGTANWHSNKIMKLFDKTIAKSQ